MHQPVPDDKKNNPRPGEELTSDELLSELSKRFPSGIVAFNDGLGNYGREWCFVWGQKTTWHTHHVNLKIHIQEIREYYEETISDDKKDLSHE